MVAIAALALSGLAARLVQIQGVDAVHYASYGAREVYQRVALPALRGAVYDRSGNLIAASSPRVDVVADDYLVTGWPRYSGSRCRRCGPSSASTADTCPSHIR